MKEDGYESASAIERACGLPYLSLIKALVDGGYIKKPNKQYLLTEKGINDLGGKYRAKIDGELVLTENYVEKTENSFSVCVWPYSFSLEANMQNAAMDDLINSLN